MSQLSKEEQKEELMKGEIRGERADGGGDGNCSHR